MNQIIEGIPSYTEPSNFDIRYTVPEDAIPLKEWFQETAILRWFPMQEPAELDDSVARWVGFHKWKCSLTGVIDGEPCGMATLWLQPYKKVSHQCQFGIVVDGKHRGKSIGSALLNNLMHLAKSKFRIELIHLEVYVGNPALSLYKRFGFKEFGRQEAWIKEDNGDYLGRIFMERFL